jgi:hypothetical protein
VGVAEGRVTLVVGIGVGFLGKILLQPGSDHARLIKTRVAIIKIKIDGLWRIPGDRWEERIGFSPFEEGDESSQIKMDYNIPPLDEFS